MQWLEIKIETLPGGVDAVASALTAGGFSEFMIEDQAEFEDFLDQNRAYWDYIDEQLQQKLQGLSRIVLYLEKEDTQGMQQLEALLARLREGDADGIFGGLPMQAEPLPDTDWEESWKDNYPPQPIGQTLLVLPYWLSDADTQGRKPVILDPGLTFGTGAHPSTRMVMEAMEAAVKPGACCIDLGSGSGILSIAALRLGAESAIGVDIDPKAEDIARENAAYNGYAYPEFTALTGNVLADKALMERLRSQPYDIVLVNIVADVIVALAPVLPQLMDKNSRLICSGILDSRLSDVLAAMTRAGLTVINTRVCEEWRCIEVIA